MESLEDEPVTERQLMAKTESHLANAGTGTRLPFAIVEDYPKEGKFSLVGCELNGEYVYVVRDRGGAGYDSRDDILKLFDDVDKRQAIREDYFRIKNGIAEISKELSENQANVVSDSGVESEEKAVARAELEM